MFGSAARGRGRVREKEGIVVKTVKVGRVEKSEAKRS